MEQAFDQRRFVLQLQRGNEHGGDDGQIGHALVLLQPHNLFAAVANGATEFFLRQTIALAQIGQQFAESLE